MPYNKEQKIKLLVLYDLLCRKTDETHALSTEEIINELSIQNIELSRKTLPQDVELLNEYGYEAVSITPELLIQEIFKELCDRKRYV